MSVGVAGGGHAVAVAQPDALHSTLVASARGLDVLRSITQPVAVLSGALYCSLPLLSHLL